LFSDLQKLPPFHLFLLFAFDVESFQTHQNQHWLGNHLGEYQHMGLVPGAGMVEWWKLQRFVASDWCFS